MGLNHSITKMYLIGAATVGVSRSEKNALLFYTMLIDTSAVSRPVHRPAPWVRQRSRPNTCKRWRVSAVSAGGPRTSTLARSVPRHITTAVADDTTARLSLSQDAPLIWSALRAEKEPGNEQQRLPL